MRVKRATGQEGRPSRAPSSALAVLVRVVVLRIVAGLGASSLAALPAIAQTPTAGERELVRLVQTELVRVGCLAAEADGIWGALSEAAVGRFNEHGRWRFDPRQVSEALLAALQRNEGRVCPVDCDAGKMPSGDRCISDRVAREPDAAPATGTRKPLPLPNLRRPSRLPDVAPAGARPLARPPATPLATPPAATPAAGPAPSPPARSQTPARPQTPAGSPSPRTETPRSETPRPRRAEPQRRRGEAREAPSGGSGLRCRLVVTPTPGGFDDSREVCD